MYVNLFSGVALMTKYCHKINPFEIYEITMVSMASYHAIQKNGGVSGSNEHFGTHEKLSPRVGSHVVFAWIHCADVRIHCTDILIECRLISLCFLIYTQKVIHHFPAHSSPIKRYQDSIFKLLTLSTNSVTNVVRTAYFQIQARSSPLKNL